MLYEPDYGRSKRKLTIGLLIVMLLLLVVPNSFRLLNQRSFGADFKAALAEGVDYIMLCEMRRGVTTDSCRIIDRKSKPGLEAALATLAHSEYELPPGHATIER